MGIASVSDPFEALGIPAVFDIDVPAVERHVRELSRVLHPDRHVTKTAAERRIALGKAIEVNEAFRVVRDPIRRAEALLRRAGVVVAEGTEPKASPAFLMDVMERREALAEARRGRDLARLERLAGEVRELENSAMKRLSAGFAGMGNDAEKARELVPLLGELRYYRRFFDEVSAIEDELALSAPAPIPSPSPASGERGERH